MISSTGNVADALVRRLCDHGVTHIFGYPGGQLTPLYDALSRQTKIRHVLARDEQAAAFMADGFARATGKPGVCLAVCGPGVYNAATALATSFTDSVPVLLISGQVLSAGAGLRSGYYHENEQQSACATFTKCSARIKNPLTAIMELDSTWGQISGGRPGPALLEIPVDILRADYTGEPRPTLQQALPPRGPSREEIETLRTLMLGWRKPLLMIGGGVITAGAEQLVAKLAERIGAPVFHTLMGKSAVTPEHSMGLPWLWATSDLTGMESAIHPLFKEADGMLAIGCRFSQAATGSWALKPPASLVQIDVDAAEIGRHYPVALSIQADAAKAIGELLKVLPAGSRPKWSGSETTSTRNEPTSELAKMVDEMRSALPRDAIVAADITRLGYLLLAKYPVYEPRTFLHPAGFVAMGFGIPAAIGAKAAFPGRTVVAVAGDGCFMMSGMELATAVQEKLPIIVVLVNDNCLSLIKAIQERRYEKRFLGVDLQNPDFGQFAKAFGVHFWRVEGDQALGNAIQEAMKAGETALIEVRLTE